MIKCIIWGAALEYQQNKNHIEFEILKGNMEVVAIVSKDKYANYIDGIKVIDKESIKWFKYDYIIVFNNEKFKIIRDEAIEMGIRSDLIINGIVFLIPCFDLKRYNIILKNQVSIVSDNCFAAMLYHYLGIKYNTPFILQQMMDQDYITMLSNLDYYLKQELILEQDLDVFSGQAPVGTLGEEKNKVRIIFNHSISFKQAKEDWDRRKTRFGSNIFVKMSIRSEEHAARFEALPYNKIGFSAKKLDYESIVLCNRYLWRVNKKAAKFGNNTIDSFTNDMKNLTAMCDIFKLLCGEKDFLREI